jgi:hypothetical protein
VINMSPPTLGGVLLKERTETTLTTQVGAHTLLPHQNNDLVRRLDHVLVIIKVVYTTPLSFRVINMSYMTLCDVLLFVPREELEVIVMEGGALSFALDPSFNEVIEDSMDADENALIAAPFQASDSDEEEVCTHSYTHTHARTCTRTHIHTGESGQRGATSTPRTTEGTGAIGLRG